MGIRVRFLANGSIRDRMPVGCGGWFAAPIWGEIWGVLDASGDSAMSRVQGSLSLFRFSASLFSTSLRSPCGPVACPHPPFSDWLGRTFWCKLYGDGAPVLVNINWYPCS